MDLPVRLRERLLAAEAEALGPRTTLGVGGPAPWVIEPRDVAELADAVSALVAARLPFRLLGHGSNIVVADEGVDEIVVHTHLMRRIHHDGGRAHALRAEAGAPLARLVNLCHRQGLAGVEPLVGIPGTVGGALVGNAGGRHGCIGDVAVAATLIDARGGLQEVPLSPDDFGYRSSPLQPGGRWAGATVVDVVLQLRPEAPSAVERRTAEILRAKRDSQPLAARSAGCMFRNTADHPSSRLIDEAGCKGLAVGRARVSERHANFIVNEGGARAADVLALVEAVRERVAAASGARLQLEVELWGPRSAAFPLPSSRS